jgi:hypothetical protein
VDGRRDDVVGGLAHVDVVVRVDGALGAELAAEHLDRAVRDDLVGVHVGGGTRPRLEHVEDEGIVQPPIYDLLGRLYDGVLLLLIEQAELVVYDGGLQLYRPQSLDEATRLSQVAYGEVIEGAAGLGAEEGVAGYLDLPHRVPFHAVRRLLLSHAKPPLRADTPAPDSHIITCTTVALYER